MQGLFVLMRSALKYLGGSISKDVSPIRSVEKALRGTAKSLGPKIGGDIDVHTSKDAGKFAPMYFFYFFFDITYFSSLGLSASSWNSHTVSVGRATEKVSQTRRSSDN